MELFVTKIVFEDIKQFAPNIFMQTSNQSEVILDHNSYKFILEFLARFHHCNFNNSKPNYFTNYLAQELSSLEIEKVKEVLQQLLELTENFPEIKIEKNKILQQFEENLKGKSAPESILHKFKTTSCLGYIWKKYLSDDDSKISKSSEEINLLNISPVYDVIIGIYCTTSNEYRKYNLECLLDYYYDSLKMEFETNNKCLNNYLEYHDYKRLTRQYISQVKILAALVKFQIIKEKGLCVENREILMDILKEFEENSKNDTSIILLEDIHLIVRKRCPKIKFDIRNFYFESMGNTSSYSGDHNKLIVNFSTNNSEKELRYFIKFFPKESPYIILIRASDLYAKEILFYEEIVPEMRRQNIRIIDECIPHYYMGIIDEFVILEDLGEAGFVTVDHRQFLEVQQIEIVLKKLAKFHASSIILEEKLGEVSGNKITLEELYARALKESYFVDDDERPSMRYFATGTKGLLYMIDKIFGENTHDFKQYVSNLRDKSVELLNNGKKFRKVINQGDLWSTNFLMKYDNAGNPIDCRLLDFQITRYTVPGHDFLLLVFFTTSHEHRQKHFQHYIDLYYGEFQTILKIYGLDPNSILSYKEFLEGCDYIFPQVVFHYNTWFQMTQVTAEVTADLTSGGETNFNSIYNDRNWFCDAAYEKDKNYQEKITEAINVLKKLFESYKKNEGYETIRYLNDIYGIL